MDCALALSSTPLCHGSTINTILTSMGKKLFPPTISYNPSTAVKVLEAFSFSGSYITIVYFVQANHSKHKLLYLIFPNDNSMFQLICFYDPQIRQQDLEGKKASAASFSPGVPGGALARDCYHCKEVYGSGPFWGGSPSTSSGSSSNVLRSRLTKKGCHDRLGISSLKSQEGEARRGTW